MLMAAPPLPPTPPLGPSLSVPLPTPLHLHIDLTAWQPQKSAVTAVPTVTSQVVGSADDRVSVNPADLTYRGEGADHIVLRLAASGQVLRLRKTPVGVVTSREDLILRAARDETFLLKVARPILGPLLTDTSRQVEVDPRVTATLRDTVEPWRQGHRQDKEINKHGVACICSDAATIFIARHDDSSLSSSPSPPPPPPPPPPHVSSSSSSSSSPTPSSHLPTHSSPVPSKQTDIVSLVITASDVESQETDSALNLTESHPTKGLPNANCDLVSNKCVLEEAMDTRTVLEVNRSTDIDGIVKPSYPTEPKNVCVEIKPKQGFLDLSTEGLPLCRYCVKQFVKRGKEGLTRSSYCPLDLFSGDLGRMRWAVDSLIHSPQNNFKVFEDGEPKDDCRPYTYLRDVIIAALTFDFTSGLAQITQTGRLSSRSALGRILTFQNLDRLGVFKAARLYEKLASTAGSLQSADTLLHDLSSWPASALPHLPTSVNLCQHHRTSEWNVKKMEQDDTSFQKQVHGSLMTQGEKEDFPEGRTDEAEEEEEVEKEVEEIVRELQRYLISTTAKDLSLMILVSGPFTSAVPKPSEPSTSPFIIQVQEGVWFKCQMTGVDLVAKPSSKILKHERDYKKLRQALVELRNHREEPKCCRL